MQGYLKYAWVTKFYIQGRKKMSPFLRSTFLWYNLHYYCIWKPRSCCVLWEYFLKHIVHTRGQYLWKMLEWQLQRMSCPYHWTVPPETITKHATVSWSLKGCWVLQLLWPCYAQPPQWVLLKSYFHDIIINPLGIWLKWSRHFIEALKTSCRLLLISTVE